MSYLIHFNRNHDKLGRFDFGDGDGDGYVSERKRIKEQQRLEDKDNKWAKKNYGKIRDKAYKPIKKEMERYVKRELNPAYMHQLKEGRISKSYINEYNRKLAELMNSTTDKLPSAPSGRVVQFIAKRGELGVHVALTDPDFSIERFKQGIYGSGRIAYRKTEVNRMEI